MSMTFGSLAASQTTKLVDLPALNPGSLTCASHNQLTKLIDHIAELRINITAFEQYCGDTKMPIPPKHDYTPFR